MAKKPWEFDYATPSERGPWDDYGTRGGQRDTGPSWIESALTGAGDALTFGWGDEMLGGLAAAGDSLGLSGLWGGMTGDQVREWSRGQQGLAQRANPLAFTAGQFGGMALGGLGLGAAARGAAGALGAAGAIGDAVGGMGLGSRLAASTATGALGGAAYEAGTEEDFSKKGEAGLWGGAGGALFGAGGGLVGEGVGQLYRSVVKPAFNPEYRGARMIAKKLDRMGGTRQSIVDNIDNAADNALTLDVLPGGTQIVMGAGTRPSAMKETLRKTLDDRNNAMADEASGMLWKSAAVKRIDAGARINELNEAKKLIDYSDVDRMQINPSLMAKDFVAHHMRSDSSPFKGAIADAIEAIRVDNPNVVGLRIVGDQYELGDIIQFPKFWRTLWTNVRENVADAKHAVRVSGQGRDYLRRIQHDASNLRKEVGDILGPNWESKQKAYRALADEQDQIRFGYDFLKDTLNNGSDIRVGEFASDFAKLTKQQKRWVRQGALARVEDVMNAADTQTGRADVLRSILGTKAKVGVLNTVLGSTKSGGGMDMRSSFAKLLPKLEQQRQYFNNSVLTGIGVNSHTADKLAAMESQQLMTQPNAGGLRNMLVKGIMGDSLDAFDERVSNKVLSLMGERAKIKDANGQVVGGLLKRINDVGGIDNYVNKMGKSDLLAMAIQAQQPEFRRRAMRSAIENGLYGNVGGQAFFDSFGLGGADVY